MNFFQITEVSNGWSVSMNRDYSRNMGEMRDSKNEFVFTNAADLAAFLEKAKRRTALAYSSSLPVQA